MAEVAILRTIQKNSHFIVAFAVAMIVVMLVIPLPAIILDILISLNITLALVVVLITMYTLEPLHFSIFPTLILITTLFRLALSISATRLILLHGNEGPAVGLADLEDRGDVRVRDRRNGARLAEQAALSFVVLLEPAREDLDRHDAP